MVVGIVIVSHSKLLAQGVCELAAQMVQGKVPLAQAAGIEDGDNPLGTDAIQVQQAIESVYTDAGVLVLMDLGSALLSAEMALEFLSEEQRRNVYLCEAPLVEGAIAATVAAATGADIHQVMAEAQGALRVKAMQLGVDDNHPQHGENRNLLIGEEFPEKEIHVKVSNRLGLHARPAAQLVALAASFQSQIKVRNITRKTEYVRADSINQVAMLGVRHGHELGICAQGVDADEALAALGELAASNFGEDASTLWSASELAADGEERGVDTQEVQKSALQGIPASTGVAIAPIARFASAANVRMTPMFFHNPPVLSPQNYHTDNPSGEWQRLQQAIETARQEIQVLLSQASTQIGDSEAAIFDAHLLFLADPLVLDAVKEQIFTLRFHAAIAWQGVVEELANQYRVHEDSYLQTRVADVIDVGERVLRILLGTAPKNLHLTQPSILVATDLTPSDTAQLDLNLVLGICTTAGSAMSHTAIIARSLGIPAVVGIPSSILQQPEGTLLALDGETGNVWIEPDPEVVTSLEAKRQAWQAAQQRARRRAYDQAVTIDGVRIHVYGNIGGVADAEVAVSNGAEGVGLLRSEFIYLDRKKPPSEDEQLSIYQAILQILGERPLTIRTLDVGGDKPLPYLDLPQENNPFLGWRGIRFCLDKQELFKTQLRAILRASRSGKIRVMFPMIATLGELRAAKATFCGIQDEFRHAGIEFDENIEVGIMIEVPSAVIIADQLAKEVDFFSIGTNDLSQYVMACDRTNPQVANLADALHPAVLRMVAQTIIAGRKAGIRVGLCGELGSDPVAAPILLGLGLQEISLTPKAIPAFKQTITRLNLTEAEIIASEALQQESAAQVRALVSTFNY